MLGGNSIFTFKHQIYAFGVPTTLTIRSFVCILFLCVKQITVLQRKNINRSMQIESGRNRFIDFWLFTRYVAIEIARMATYRTESFECNGHVIII